MRSLLIGLGVVILFLAVVIGVTSAMSPSSEVVTLVTHDAGGVRQETPLWIVEEEDGLWLRGGSPGASWIEQLRQNPSVSLRRDDETRTYRAELVQDADVRDRIHEAMAHKYGASDSLVGLWSTREKAIPIRLHPKTDVAAGARE